MPSPNLPLEALPAMPEPEILAYQTDSVMRSYAVFVFSRSQMQAYGLSCYQAGERAGAADERARSEAAFKNFHRSLCERFGYVHDPIDWKRDQVSLEEHIAAFMAQKPVAQVVAVEPEGPDGYGVNWLKGNKTMPGNLLYASPTRAETPDMTRDEAIEIARSAATRSDEEPYHEYQPTPEKARDWMPHEWVIDAILYAARMREAAEFVGKNYAP